MFENKNKKLDQKFNGTTSSEKERIVHNFKVNFPFNKIWTENQKNISFQNYNNQTIKLWLNQT